MKPGTRDADLAPFSSAGNSKSRGVNSTCTQLGTERVSPVKISVTRFSLTSPLPPPSPLVRGRAFVLCRRMNTGADWFVPFHIAATQCRGRAPMRTGKIENAGTRERVEEKRHSRSAGARTHRCQAVCVSRA